MKFLRKTGSGFYIAYTILGPITEDLRVHVSKVGNV